MHSLCELKPRCTLVHDEVDMYFKNKSVTHYCPIKTLDLHYFLKQYYYCFKNISGEIEETTT